MRIVISSSRVYVKGLQFRKLFRKSTNLVVSHINLAYQLFLKFYDFDLREVPKATRGRNRARDLRDSNRGTCRLLREGRRPL